MDFAMPRTNQPLEAGRPQDDTKAYRRTLGRFGTGVTVVTAKVDGNNIGMTVNSFASVSLDPPLILWSLADTSTNFDVMRVATHFAVNVLSENQAALALHFARSGGDKFTGQVAADGIGGVPLLPSVAAVFECSAAATHNAGDHVIFVGQVERFTRFPLEPLLFKDGRFGCFVDHPTASKTSEGDDAGAELLMLQLRLAASRLSAAFEDSRMQEGISANEGRVLWQATLHPGSTPAQIAEQGYLGIESVLDTMQQLVKRGYLAMDAGRLEVTASGREKIISVRRKAKALEEEELAHMGTAERAILGKALTRLVNGGVNS